MGPRKPFAIGARPGGHSALTQEPYARHGEAAWESLGKYHKRRGVDSRLPPGVASNVRRVGEKAAAMSDVLTAGRRLLGRAVRPRGARSFENGNVADRFFSTANAVGAGPAAGGPMLQSPPMPRFPHLDPHPDAAQVRSLFGARGQQFWRQEGYNEAVPNNLATRSEILHPPGSTGRDEMDLALGRQSRGAAPYGPDSVAEAEARATNLTFGHRNLVPPVDPHPGVPLPEGATPQAPHLLMPKTDYRGRELALGAGLGGIGLGLGSIGAGVHGLMARPEEAPTPARPTPTEPPAPPPPDYGPLPGGGTAEGVFAGPIAHNGDMMRVPPQAPQPGALARFYGGPGAAGGDEDAARRAEFGRFVGEGDANAPPGLLAQLGGSMAAHPLLYGLGAAGLGVGGGYLLAQRRRRQREEEARRAAEEEMFGKAGSADPCAAMIADSPRAAAVLAGCALLGHDEGRTRHAVIKAAGVDPTLADEFERLFARASALAPRQKRAFDAPGVINPDPKPVPPPKPPAAGPVPTPPAVRQRVEAAQSAYDRTQPSALGAMARAVPGAVGNALLAPGRLIEGGIHAGVGGIGGAMAGVAEGVGRLAGQGPGTPFGDAATSLRQSGAAAADAGFRSMGQALVDPAAPSAVRELQSNNTAQLDQAGMDNQADVVRGAGLAAAGTSQLLAGPAQAGKALWGRLPGAAKYLAGMGAEMPVYNYGGKALDAAHEEISPRYAQEQSDRRTIDSATARAIRANGGQFPGTEPQPAPSRPSAPAEDPPQPPTVDNPPAPPPAQPEQPPTPAQPSPSNPVPPPAQPQQPAMPPAGPREEVGPQGPKAEAHAAIQGVMAGLQDRSITPQQAAQQVTPHVDALAQLHAEQMGVEPEVLKKQIAAKLQDGSWDQRDADWLARTPNGEVIARNYEDMGGFQGWWDKSSGLDKAALGLGIPMTIFGALSGLMGEGGLGSILMAVLGLGGAAFGLHRSGLLDGTGLGNTLGSVFGGSAPNTPPGAAGPPAAPAAPAMSANDLAMFRGASPEVQRAAIAERTAKDPWLAAKLTAARGLNHIGGGGLLGGMMRNQLGPDVTDADVQAILNASAPAR